MFRHSLELIQKVRSLRASGKLYPEIVDHLKINIPKSTLSYWCRGILLPEEAARRARRLQAAGLMNARKRASVVHKEKRKNYFALLSEKNKKLPKIIENGAVTKIALAMLFLGEGTKTNRGSLTFGNSNPYIIALFLKLLRQVYKVNENKLHCTVQCRADQNTTELETFWSAVTKVPLKRFYKTRIDPRTIGKPSRKLDYKGVCRVDYFSADVYNELKVIIELINKKYKFNFGPMV